MKKSNAPSRRRFLGGALAAGGALLGAGAWPRRALPQTSRPGIPFGVQTGEVTQDRAVVWSASDRPARLLIEYAATERFRLEARTISRLSSPNTVRLYDFGLSETGSFYLVGEAKKHFVALEKLKQQNLVSQYAIV